MRMKESYPSDMSQPHGPGWRCPNCGGWIEHWSWHGIQDSIRIHRRVCGQPAQRRRIEPVGRKSRDIPTKISFKTERVHTVLFNPEAETEERKGAHAEYEAMPVQEIGALAYL